MMCESRVAHIECPNRAANFVRSDGRRKILVRRLAVRGRYDQRKSKCRRETNDLFIEPSIKHDQSNAPPMKELTSLPGYSRSIRPAQLVDSVARFFGLVNGRAFYWRRNAPHCFRHPPLWSGFCLAAYCLLLTAFFPVEFLHALTHRMPDYRVGVFLQFAAITSYFRYSGITRGYCGTERAFDLELCPGISETGPGGWKKEQKSVRHAVTRMYSKRNIGAPHVTACFARRV